MFGVTAWVKDRPVTKVYTGRRIGLSHCVYWAKDRPFARSVLGERSDCHKVRTGRRIGLSQGLYWAKDRPVTLSVLSDGWTVKRSVLNEGWLVKVVLAKDRPVTKSLLGKGSAYHEGYTGEYEREKSADVHGVLLDGSQRDKCKELCATVNGLEEIPAVWN